MMKKNVSKKLKFISGLVENIVEKGGNACYRHFLLFPKYLQKTSISKSLKSQDCVVNG